MSWAERLEKSFRLKVVFIAVELLMEELFLIPTFGWVVGGWTFVALCTTGLLVILVYRKLEEALHLLSMAGLPFVFWTGLIVSSLFA